MYVTAHLVRSSEGDEGINAFVHVHGVQFPWPEDAAPLADTDPGRVVHQRIDLPPGGNQVRAYLDVLAPDQSARDAIEGALARLANDLEERRNPTVFTQGAVTIRFGVELGLERLRAQQLHMLAPIVLQLLDEYRSSS
jgi:hypothetical protein